MIRRSALAALLALVPVVNGGEADVYRGMGAGYGPCYAAASPGEWELMRGESRGWPTANNPRSSAFGCFQMVASMRRRYYPAICPIDTVDVDCQMAGGRAYITERYGSTAAAVAHRRARGYF